MLVACVSGMAMFTYGRIVYTDPQYRIWDLHDYRTMAEASPSLAQNVRQPFVFRILGPYLAGLMPFSTDTSFLILTLAIGLALPLLFFLYLSESLVSPATAALTTVFFILNKYLYGFSIWNYFQINDLLALVDILLLMWAMSSQKWVIFGILLFLGSLTKEVPLLMIPVAFVFALQSPNRAWLPVLVAVVPALLAAGMTRLLVHSDQGNNLLDAFFTYNRKLLSGESWFRLLVNSFIPFSLVPLIFFKSTLKYFKARKHELVFLVLVVFSTLFGYNNERLMAPAFMVFYPLLAVTIQGEFTSSKIGLSVISFAAVLGVLHHAYARYPLPREWTIPLSLFALTVVTAMFIFQKFAVSKTNLGRVSSGGMPA